MTATATRRDRTALIRIGLYGLTVIGILATAFELASERHWQTPDQLIPWVALAVLALATVLALLPWRSARLIARVLAVAVLGASIYGVLDHIAANHDSGFLDQRYADVWESLSPLRQWWYAATKTVGPAPTLAPGMLGQTALLLLLTGFGEPARDS
ncbi:hypothetical protein [Mycolicibacterium mageritense]|uniref:hypothetical protein n=1 Tax=Mycolicibacterium mageritense TaxID=53462 RepID=UPI0023F18662|nr:hypothetical protein [Mycolicibacterium mageritense]